MSLKNNGRPAEENPMENTTATEVRRLHRSLDLLIAFVVAAVLVVAIAVWAVPAYKKSQAASDRQMDCMGNGQLCSNR